MERGQVGNALGEYMLSGISARVLFQVIREGSFGAEMKCVTFIVHSAE